MTTWAEEKIALANQYVQMVNDGEISPEECKELLQDLIRTDEVLEAADDMKMKAQVESAVMGLIAVL